MKPCVRLPCYHWSQTYIFPSLLSSPLISLLSLFGAHTVWRRMMNTQLSKAHMLGVLFLFFFSRPDHLTHTHSQSNRHYATVRVWCCQDKWTTMLHSTVQPTSILKKVLHNDFQLQNLKSDDSTCWVINGFSFFRALTHLHCLIFPILSPHHLQHIL